MRKDFYGGSIEPVLEQEIEHLRNIHQDKTFCFRTPSARMDYVERTAYFRKYNSLIPLIQSFGAGNRWLTVGDSYGNDGIFLKSQGIDATCSDVYTGILEVAVENGTLSNCLQANLESLPFDDNSFDIIVCSMCLHHLSRPYLGLHEMHRVASKAFIIIEPNDTTSFWTYPMKRAMKWTLRMNGSEHSYEHVGNYLYTFSARELEKFAVGLEMKNMATRHFNTSWNESLSNPIVKKMTRLRILLKDILCFLRIDAPVNIASIFFKQSIKDKDIDILKAMKYKVATLPHNDKGMQK